MKKLEIILSQAIDEDFSRLCEVREVGQHFTKSVGVMGKGNTIPKMADDTWPQENVHYMMIVDDDEVESIRQIVEYLRTQFPECPMTQYNKVMGLPFEVGELKDHFTKLLEK